MWRAVRRLTTWWRVSIALLVAAGVAWAVESRRHHDELFFFSVGSAGFEHEVRLRLWLALGQDPNGEWEGRTPLVAMGFKPWTTAPLPNLRILLDAGADPDRPSSYGVLPLVEFVCWGAWDQVRLLLDHGADPGRVEPRGRSAAVCLDSGNDRSEVPDRVHLLLDHGLDPCFAIDGREVQPPQAEPRLLSDQLIRWGHPALGREVAELCARKSAPAVLEGAGSR